MDLASHALVSGLLASAGLERRYGRAATAVLVAASLAPDLDGLLGALGPEYFLAYHRGPLTHSLGGAVLLSAALAAVASCVPRSLPAHVVFGLGVTGTSLHLAGDLLTSWPFPVLYPFSGREYAADLIGFLDPVLLAMLAAGTLAARHWRAGAALVVGLTALAAAGYLGIRLEQREAAAALLPADARTGKVTVLPEGLGLGTWDIIAERPDGYSAYRVDVISRTVVSQVQLRSVGDPTLAAASRASPLVHAFLRRARFPVYAVSTEGDETMVEWRDVQLTLSGGLAGGVRVVLGHGRRIVDAELLVGLPRGSSPASGASPPTRHRALP